MNLHQTSGFYPKKETTAYVAKKAININTSLNRSNFASHCNFYSDQKLSIGTVIEIPFFKSILFFFELLKDLHFYFSSELVDQN